MGDWKTLGVETVEEHVARVELRRPERGNALSPEVFEELPRAFEALSEDPAVRVVILGGAGDHFCYGLDLVAAMPLLGPLVTGPQLAGDRMKLLDLIERLQRATAAPEACRKPVIAEIQGWCIGGGLDLVAACDLRFCSADARFSLRETRVAMVADLGSLQRLPHLVGEGHVRDMALTGRDVDADEAGRMGLVNEVLPDRDALRARVLERARAIAANPPLVVQGVRRVLHEARRDRDAALLRYVALWNAAFLQSEDLAEALAAFMERRPPRFTGR